LEWKYQNHPKVKDKNGHLIEKTHVSVTNACKLYYCYLL